MNEPVETEPRYELADAIGYAGLCVALALVAASAAVPGSVRKAFVTYLWDEARRWNGDRREKDPQGRKIATAIERYDYSEEEAAGDDLEHGGGTNEQRG